MYKSLLLALCVILTTSGCQSTPNRQPDDTLSPAQYSSLRDQVAAQIEAGNLDQAESLMGKVGQFQAEDFLLLADICDARGQHRCVADALIQASLLDGLGETDNGDLHDRIWTALSRAHRGPDAFTHRYHLAWWQLQQEIRAASSLTAQIKVWQNWKQKNPSHPATIRPPQGLLQLDNYSAPDIAVLLPLSGRLATAGRAIQNAFAAGYLAENYAATTVVRFYDTEALPLGQLWEQALNDGADVVVGPLLKSRAEDFARLTANSPVPRLTLNYLETDPVDLDTSDATPLFQLGIAIEDEAASLAQYVLLQGLERVAIVHGKESWALRAADAFSANWAYPLTTAHFEQDKDLTRAVGEAMQVASSETRKTEIANIIGQQVEFLPRARQDLEAIIALTNNVESRALVPALRFHFGDHLPVFATSQAARRGNLDPLEGYYLTEMPLFAEADKHRDLTAAFDLAGNPLAELYALGYDAYRVATWLPALNPHSSAAFAGASGYLWLDAHGVFRRELNLTQVGAGGALRLVE